MNIIAVGINHKNTPIEIREQLFLNPTQQDLLLSELKSNPAIMEACVLSTCNRVEIYAQVLDKEIDKNTFIKFSGGSSIDLDVEFNITSGDDRKAEVPVGVTYP